MKVGIVGYGCMGRVHCRCWRALECAQVTAICESDQEVLKNTKETMGNIEGVTGETDPGEIETYADYDKMLAQAGLDAVSIALPSFLHADMSIKALEAGLHVLCEKPMALNVKDCDRMIEAARKSGKTLQIGHCVRFWPEYARTREIVESGEHGKIVAASFRRLSAWPGWGAKSWFTDEERSGGVALDLHIHDTDFVQYLLGKPKAVRSTAATVPAGGMAHIATEYFYDNNTIIIAEGGWAMMPAFGFEMSFNIMLERATIIYDNTREPMFRICPADGDAFTPEVGPGDGYSREIEHFARVISGEEVEPVITPEQSRDAISIVEAEKRSAASGKKVVVAGE